MAYQVNKEVVAIRPLKLRTPPQPHHIVACRCLMVPTCCTCGREEGDVWRGGDDGRSSRKPPEESTKLVAADWPDGRPAEISRTYHSCPVRPAVTFSDPVTAVAYVDGQARIRPWSAGGWAGLRPCLVHPKSKKFSRFFIKSNLAAHAWSIKYRRK